jgi:hypothetical protein
VRSRSWAQDNQKETTCSMRLQRILNHTHEQMTNKYYAATTAPKGSPLQSMCPVSARLLLVRPGAESLFLLITDAVKR